MAKPYTLILLTFRKIKFDRFAIVLLVVFGLFFVSNGNPLIGSDGFGSYFTTHCLLTEGSPVCKNKPGYGAYPSINRVTEYNDRYLTAYAPGSAIFNLPGQIVARSFDAIGFKRLSRLNHTYAEGLAFLLTASFTSIFSFYLIYKALRNLKFSKYISYLATLSGYIASYTLWYTILEHGFNHIYEIFGMSLALYAFSKTKVDKNANLRSYGLLGLGFSIIVLCRPPYAFILVPVAILLLFKRQFKNLIYFGIAGIPAAIALFTYNYISYGKPVASGYKILWNQDFIFSQFKFFEVLFSAQRGFFIYSPIFFVATITFMVIILKKFIYKDKAINKKFLYISIFSIYALICNTLVYAFWPMWWGGASFGQRFLIALYPLMVVGIAVFYKQLLYIRFKKVYLYWVGFTLSLILVGFSLIIMLLYRFTPVSVDPTLMGDPNTDSNNAYTPLKIISYNINLAKDSKNPLDFTKKFLTGLNGGSSFISLIVEL